VSDITTLSVTQNYLHMSNQDMVDNYSRFSPSNAINVQQKLVVT